jgi:predicted PurR-regulated permease PerM
VRRRAKKKYKVDESCDPCCRSFLAVNLFLLILLMSFFVICAFVTNEYIRTGVQHLPKTVNQSTDDIMLFLNNTQYEINTLLRTNFNQLEQELGDSLDKSGLIVKNRLAVLSEAASLENLTDIVSSESFIIKSYISLIFS